MEASVLMHLPRVWGGGLEAHVFALSQQLARRGAVVTLVTDRRFGRADGRLARLKEDGVETVVAPERTSGSRWLQVARHARFLVSALSGRRFDLVICHGVGGTHGFCTRFVGGGGRIIWHDHSCGARIKHYPERYSRPVFVRYPWAALRIAKKAHVIISGSKASRDNLVEIQGIQKPVVVAPPVYGFGAELLAARPTERAPEATLHIGVFGSLEEVKGTGPLLEIWRELRGCNAMLHFFGMDDGGRYQRYAQGLGLESSTVFHGAYRCVEMPVLAGKIDFAVVPSIAEGYCITAVELMALGVPFVMTEVGAGAEFTRDNPDAVLAPLDHAGVRNAITTMIEQVRSGKTSRRRLHALWRQRFLSQDTLKRHLELLEIKACSRP